MSDPYGLDEGCTWAWTWEHGMCPIEIEGITVTVPPACITTICEPAERDRPWAGGAGGGPGPRGGGGGGAGGGKGAGPGPSVSPGPGTPVSRGISS
jgi:hypothetical protein